MWFEEEKHRIKLEANEWIDVSKYETEADHRKLLDAIAGSSEIAADGTYKANPDIGGMRRAVLEARVKDWSFATEGGNKVPVTPENIGKLPRQVTDKIMEEIDRLDRGADPLGAAKGKPSSGTSQTQ